MKLSRKALKFAGLALILSVVVFVNLSAQPETPAFQTFELSELIAQLEESDSTSTLFLDESSMSAEVVLQTSASFDFRSESEFDQIYYFFQGQAQLVADGSSIAIEPGLAVFSRGGTERYLEAVSEELFYISVTVKQPANLNSPSFRTHTMAEMESTRSSNQNVWNPFLRENNVIFGLYMLPERIGGDGRLVHPFDELNIVVRGSSKFEVDNDVVDISEASIMFVRAGLGHYFHSLKEDTAILILWEQP